ncbi:MAG TPA: replicative DNA helicase, partial [Actinomycetota bacterium]
KVAARRIHSDFRPIRELLAESMEQLEMLASRDSDITGVSTGFRDIDHRLSGLQRQNLIIVAARPAMGKTSFVLNVAHNAAMKSSVPVVIFSLEMSQNEIVQRLISSESHVDSTRLRSGHLSEADWTRVSNAVGKLDTAPLYIDDSASISMMEIRAKCQRLKQQQDLGLVVVDYIQLMQGSRRTENRVQEVSEISRGLKILAKEMDVPVVAVSQLSRQPEQGGGERRPQLSHLRECVTGDTLVCLADGRRVPIESLVGTTPTVLAMDNRGRIVESASDLVWKVGRRPVFRVRLASGRSIRATGKHRVFGFDGWCRVDALGIGDELATFPADDLQWDKVIAVEPAGEEDVYDLTVPGPASWLADGVVSHNSGAIEQDADVVMFVYRDEYYNKETEAKGEAEIIVAKHRNGPVGTEKLAFLGQYTKFADLARE